MTSPTATWTWRHPTSLLPPLLSWPRSILTAPSRPHHKILRRRVLVALLLGLLLFLWATSSSASYQARDHVNRLPWTTSIWKEMMQKQGSLSEAGLSAGQHNRRRPKIIRLSMLYGDSQDNEQYEKALLTHQRHSTRWGHEFKVLRQNISLGFWNKPTWLLSTVIQELAKPNEDRLEWIMWVDADSIILNPSVPPAIFLPPANLPDIHLVVTQDHNGLNTGIMFLRVHPWTIQMLTQTLAYPTIWPDVDLGRNADQEAMKRILLQPSLSPSPRTETTATLDTTTTSGYCENVIYLPRTWINAYEWHSGYEGHPGDLLVHFPGLEADVRRSHMRQWFHVLHQRPRDWDLPPARTGILDAAAAFWRQIRAAVTAAEKMQARLAAMPNVTDNERARWLSGQRVTRRLQDALWHHADNVTLVQSEMAAAEAHVW